MAGIQGIGGVFIDNKDAKRLARWYEENLGITMEAHPDGIGYYHVFSTRDVATALLRKNPVFAINQAKELLAEKGRGFVLNFRVDDLHLVLKQLRTRNVVVEDQLQEWERGKHGWIRDLDGNKIELYEEIQPDETGEQQ